MIILGVFLYCFVVITQGFVRRSHNSICFGELHLDLPIRYFHVQLVENGRNLTESAGTLVVEYNKTPDGCRFGRSVVDRFDGSYILRIRLYGTCESINIDVSLNGQKLCGDTVQIERDGIMMYPEQCFCSEPELVRDWILRAQCPREEQLRKDLNQWKEQKIDAQALIDHAEAKYARDGRSSSVLLYKVINNKLYRRAYGHHVDFKMFSDAMFLSVLEKMRVPDVTFLFNLGDYPLGYDLKKPLPMVSWCGSRKTTDIVVPTYSVTESVVSGMSRVSKDMHTSRGVSYTKWEERSDKAIFRGRDSNQLRLNLAKLSEEKPELLDAGITRFFFFNKTEYPPEKESILFQDFFKYKYVISVDGTVAAYRLPFLLSGDSIILKSDSEYYEHFYSRLIPYKHYVPFNERNFEEQLEKAKGMDWEKYKSDLNRLVLDHLQPRNIYCYYARFFQEYSKLLFNHSSDVSDMEEVTVKVNERSCVCDEEKKKKTSVKETDNKEEF